MRIISQILFVLFILLFFSCQNEIVIRRLANSNIYFNDNGIEGVIFDKNNEIFEKDTEQIKLKLYKIESIVKEFIYGGNGNRLWREMEEEFKKVQHSDGSTIETLRDARSFIQQEYYRYKRQYSLLFIGEDLDFDKAIVFYTLIGKDDEWQNEIMYFRVFDGGAGLWSIVIDCNKKKIEEFSVH